MLDASSYPLHSTQGAIACGPPEHTRDPSTRRTYLQDAFLVIHPQTPPIASPSLRTNRRPTFRVQHPTLLPRRRSVFASPLRATVCSHALRPSTPYNAQTRSETPSPHIHGAFFGSRVIMRARWVQRCDTDSADGRARRTGYLADDIMSRNCGPIHASCRCCSRGTRRRFDTETAPVESV